jgi:hypothetical protein
MLLCPTEVILHEETVAFINQGLGIVSIVADSNVDIFLGLEVIVLKEVEE